MIYLRIMCPSVVILEDLVSLPHNYGSLTHRVGDGISKLRSYYDMTMTNGDLRTNYKYWGNEKNLYNFRCPIISLAFP